MLLTPKNAIIHSEKSHKNMSPLRRKFFHG
jgi:hypothetical protein